MTRSRFSCRRHGSALTKTAAASVAAVAGLALTIGGTYAVLNATAYNTTAQTIGSGTLKLVLADNGAGFTSAIANLAPTDIVNRYVDLSNTGTLDGRALTLAIADATPTKLTTDATNGLRVTITQCSAATWTPATGVCGGTTSALVTNVALKTIITTPATLIAGTVAAGSAVHLQISVTLPDQTETTTNGVLPGSTIQGLSASITWTFTDSQRTGTTINS
jgi:spore coat-associated protein N